MPTLRQYFDHTLLQPTATPDDIRKLCKEAKEYKFYSVCVNPVYAKLAKQSLSNTNVKVCAVIDFPLGSSSAFAKVKMAEEACIDGAQELDIVIPIGLLLSGYYNQVEEHINYVVKNTECYNIIIKVIIETGLLSSYSHYLIQTACSIVKNAGADFVKTSTGFSPYGGATIDAVSIMRETVGSNFGIKAAGGIHTLTDALAMIKAGADRLGASSSVDIMKEAYELNILKLFRRVP